MRIRSLAIVSALWLVTPSALGDAVFAQEAGVFEKWLNPASPACVSVAEIEKVSKVIKLTPEQFQFVRALYVAIPPMSRELPPGDHAIVATSEGLSMLALVDGAQTCARFLEPDFLRKMLDDVATGESPKVGQGL